MRRLSELLIAEFFVVGMCGGEITNLFAQLFALTVVAYVEYLYALWKLKRHEICSMILSIMLAIATIIHLLIELIKDIFNR